MQRAVINCVGAYQYMMLKKYREFVNQDVFVQLKRRERNMGEEVSEGRETQGKAKLTKGQKA